MGRALILAALALLALVAPPAAAAKGRPNVLLIITDDQRASGTMEAMKRTQRLFGEHGERYRQAYVTTPLCCPSRSSIYSGLYAHNHGITENDGTGFDPSTSWPVRLRAAGYRTAVFGAYLLKVPMNQAPFDVKIRTDFDDPEDPRKLARYTRGFLARSESVDSKPWAMVVAGRSPHTPFNVKPKDRHKVKPLDAGEAYAEPDLADKHPSVARVARRFSEDHAEEMRRGQLRELQATDEMVGAIFRQLRHNGERRNTLAIFTSDNGYLWGEHRLFAKTWPYLEASKVPLFLRWTKGMPEDSVRRELVANVDLAPTIYDATGVAPPASLDGRSLLEPSSPSRRALLLEFPSPTAAHPGWRAYLSAERHYIEWTDGFVEDYRLAGDPSETQASNTPVPALRAWLDQAASCDGAGCP